MDQGDDGDGQTANADYASASPPASAPSPARNGTALAAPRAVMRKTPTTRFVSLAFLSALEEFGLRRARAPAGRAITCGWKRRDGRLLGAVPCYLKSHSQGEYVFDHGWADAFERAGGHYYPKLQCAVPFTPVTGPRLLVGEGARISETVKAGARRGPQSW